MYEGKIEIEKVQLEGFKFREGLTDWKVLREKRDTSEEKSESSYFEEIKTAEQVAADKNGLLKETMLPSQYSEGIKS